jgi:hypothetical protein
LEVGITAFINADLIAAGLSPDAAARRLVAELDAPPGAGGAEPEVTLAPAGRLVPRLVRGLAAPVLAGPLQLGIAQPGRLGTLRWEPAATRKPGPGEVALRIEAAGLNFRDLMWAQGLLPEDVLDAGFAGPTLGMECAGVVEEAGPGVALRPGARVFGVAPAALAARAVTRVEALAVLPDGLGFDAAATIPVAFMTALYALEDCARLQAGETVLIHGGAGAVGLAALQVAQAVGARVAMTAGSAAKRAFLRAAGADLVLDSRDPGFADAWNNLARALAARAVQRACRDGQEHGPRRGKPDQGRSRADAADRRLRQVHEHASATGDCDAFRARQLRARAAGLCESNRHPARAYE